MCTIFPNLLTFDFESRIDEDDLHIPISFAVSTNFASDSHDTNNSNYPQGSFFFAHEDPKQMVSKFYQVLNEMSDLSYEKLLPIYEPFLNDSVDEE